VLGVASFFPRWTGRYTVRRRLIQLAFLTVFAVLPILDLLRFDFEAGRLHAFGQEIWLDEWAILWLFLMFAMWLVGAAALVLGRVYCGYACPQMVFSELAHDLDALSRGLLRPLDRRLRDPAARVLSLALLAAVSVASAVLFMGYFAPLPEVLRRLARLEVSLWIGAVGAASTLLAWLVFGFVRESFCRTVCPYGLLQGLIEDGRSLHVGLDEGKGACIDCGACARVCPMEIDVRDGPFQIECTRCGSCIDACQAVLGRLKPARPSVLAFAFGRAGGVRWDAKRVLVGLATVGFGVAFLLVLAARDAVSLRLSPLYQSAQAEASGDVAESRFLLRAANRGTSTVQLSVQTEGLPATTAVEGLGNGLVPGGRERSFTLVVRVPRSEVHSSVTPFAWVIDAADRRERFRSAFVSFGRRPS
jgi:polyferredoxin